MTPQAATTGAQGGRLQAHRCSVTLRAAVSQAHVSDEATRATQRAYDAAAERYRQRWHHADVLADERAWLVARLPAGGRVLDVGCGTGRDLLALRGDGVDAVGVDLSPAMLATPGLPGRVVVADMRAIPLADGSVDGWWAAASLLHLDAAGLRATLGELWRISRLEAIGFVSVKRGDGQAWESMEGGSARYVRYWQAGELDGELAAAGWTIERTRTAADPLGRQPWLSRLVRRTSEASVR